MAYIEIDGACKEAKGRKLLDNVTLAIDKGLIYGFVGVNGSGKTMLFRAISGLISLDSGTIAVDGKVLGKEISFPENLGLIIENVGLWPYMSGVKNLEMLAKVRNVIGAEEIKNAISRVGLDPGEKKSYRKYSLGQKQRLLIAQALMEKPELLVLDEPTNALDKDGVELIRSILLEEKRRGATILLASHNSEDISGLCDEVFQVRAGQVSKSGGVAS
jgi:ABC-2 type transport system ATP-binding protein